MTKLTWELPEHDRHHLRTMARRQAELAKLPIMAEREKMWYELNDGAPGTARPPVIIETWTFDRDFMPAAAYGCTSALGRDIEAQLLRQVRNHELIDDDKVMPDAYEINWFTELDEFGVKVERVAGAKDEQGIETGFQFIHPIKDLRRDLELLKPCTCRVDRAKTMAWKAFLEELFGDLLPVRIVGGIIGFPMLTNRVVELMGMEAFFMAMYDCPDEFHRLMAYLRDNALRMMRWAEAEGLMVVNNGNQQSCGSSYNFTRRLPAPGAQPGQARLCDMWGVANSQETVGVSPEMFHEFCAPYYQEACRPLGLLYYGCCEPTHPYWNDLKNLPHLKKISISKWCDEAFMGEVLQNTDIVYSRKPDPNLLGVDVELDEAAWAASIRQTLAATRRLNVEFVVRDVYTVHGNLAKVKGAVALARQEIVRAGR